MKKRDLSEAGKSGIEMKRLDGPPSAGATHSTPASNLGGINITPLDNPSSAGNGPQASIGHNEARANTDANSTGGAGT